MSNEKDPHLSSPTRPRGAAPEPIQAFDALAAVAELDHALRTPAESRSSGPEYTGQLKGEIGELAAILAQKDNDLASVRAQLAAMEDEMDRAVRRRSDAAQKEATKLVESVLVDMIEVIDDLNRALNAALDQQSPLAEGVRLVRKRFAEKLSHYGVHHRPSLGQKFDPRFHECVSVVAPDGAHLNGTIAAVIAEGWERHDTVLRPARVVIAKD